MKTEINSTRDVLPQTDKLDEAVRFYQSVLGLRVTHQSETLVGFETGSFCLYIDQGRRMDRSSNFASRTFRPPNNSSLRLVAAWRMKIRRYRVVICVIHSD